MKNNKIFLVLIGFLLLVSVLQLTSACKSNVYNDLNNNDNVIFIIRNANQDDYGSTYWENEDRLPVSNYLDGYSYRATKAYEESRNERIYLNTYYEERHDYTPYVAQKKIPSYNYRDDNKGIEYYYTYEDYMRTYTKHECYSTPPKDKLFYVKCP